METILNKESRAAIELMIADGIIAKDTAERYFPELKESEDERIIGNIIATIHLYYGEPLEDEAKEMIAWLESRCQTFTKKDVDDAYLKGVCDAKHEIERQGKINMGISEATKKELEDNLNKALEKETAESYKKFLDEQEPAENSEKVLEYATEEKDMTEYNKGFECGKQRVLKYPEDFGLYKKSAWSEEDEKMWAQVINEMEAIKSNSSTVFEKNIVQDKIDWLKSLRPQNRWKPCDEQMDALNYAVNLMASSERPTENDLYYNILKSLRQQLKKLREK